VYDIAAEMGTDGLAGEGVEMSESEDRSNWRFFLRGGL